MKILRLFLPFLLAFVVVAQVTPYSAVKNTAADVAATPIPITPPVQRLTVNMLGYSAINDAQGGVFFWSPTSTDIASFDTILSSNPTYAVTGRWVRLVGSPVSFDGIARTNGTGFFTSLIGNTYIASGQIATADFGSGAHLLFNQRQSFFNGFTDNAASQEFVAQQTPLVVQDIAELLAIPNPPRGQYATVMSGPLSGTWQYCPDEMAPDNAATLGTIRRPNSIPTDADQGRWMFMAGDRRSTTVPTLNSLVASNPQLLTASNLSTNALSFATVQVQGYAVPGDGGGATWWWDSTNTTTETAFNSGYLRQASGVSTGRWRALTPGNIVRPEMWGAKGDAATDDSSALQYATIGSSQAGLSLEITSGKKFYITTTQWWTNSNISVIGDGEIHSRAVTAAFRTTQPGYAWAWRTNFEVLYTNIHTRNFTLRMLPGSTNANGWYFIGVSNFSILNHKFFGVGSAYAGSDQNWWAVAVTGWKGVINNNLIENPGSIFRDGVHVAGGSDISVTGNTINSGDDAMAVGADFDYPASRITFTGNVANSTHGNAIRVINGRAFAPLATDYPTNVIEDLVFTGNVGYVGQQRNGAILLEEHTWTAYGASLPAVPQRKIRNIVISSCVFKCGNGVGHTGIPYGITVAGTERVTFRDVTILTPYGESSLIRNPKDILYDNVTLEAPSLTSAYTFYVFASGTTDNITVRGGKWTQDSTNLLWHSGAGTGIHVDGLTTVTTKAAASHFGMNAVVTNLTFRNHKARGLAANGLVNATVTSTNISIRNNGTAWTAASHPSNYFAGGTLTTTDGGARIITNSSEADGSGDVIVTISSAITATLNEQATVGSTVYNAGTSANPRGTIIFDAVDIESGLAQFDVEARWSPKVKIESGSVTASRGATNAVLGGQGNVISDNLLTQDPLSILRVYSAEKPLRIPQLTQATATNKLASDRAHGHIWYNETLGILQYNGDILRIANVGVGVLGQATVNLADTNVPMDIAIPINWSRRFRPREILVEWESGASDTNTWGGVYMSPGGVSIAGTPQELGELDSVGEYKLLVLGGLATAHLLGQDYFYFRMTTNSATPATAKVSIIGDNIY